MNEKEYVYALSEDGEYRFDTEDEAMDEALENCEEEDYPPSIYRGEKICLKLGDFLDAHGLLELLREEAYGEFFGEYADDWLAEVTPEQEADLAAHIDAWATKNGHQPTFFKVENVVELKVETSATEVKKAS